MKQFLLPFCHFFFICYLIFCRQELPFPSSSMGSWILFYSKCYNPSFSIFFQICPKFGQWELLQAVLCVLLRSSHKFLSTYLFLVQQDIPGSPSTSPSPDLEQSFPQQDFVPFRGEWYLEIKFWAIGVLSSARISLNLGPIGGQS